MEIKCGWESRKGCGWSGLPSLEEKDTPEPPPAVGPNLVSQCTLAWTPSNIAGFFSLDAQLQS